MRDKENYGVVYLVGSGPGDPELLTIKAKRLIAEADVILYDQLPGEEILAMMPDSAEKIDVGKRAGQHTLPQDKINEILATHICLDVVVRKQQNCMKKVFVSRLYQGLLLPLQHQHALAYQ